MIKALCVSKGKTIQDKKAVAYCFCRDGHKNCPWWKNNNEDGEVNHCRHIRLIFQGNGNGHSPIKKMNRKERRASV